MPFSEMFQHFTFLRYRTTKLYKILVLIMFINYESSFFFNELIHKSCIKGLKLLFSYTVWLKLRRNFLKVSIDEMVDDMRKKTSKVEG